MSDTTERLQKALVEAVLATQAMLKERGVPVSHAMIVGNIALLSHDIAEQMSESEKGD